MYSRIFFIFYLIYLTNELFVDIALLVINIDIH